MLEAEQIRARIPHAGLMSLLERVVSWDESEIHCQATFHPDRPHPLAIGGKLPMTAMAEYGAQAMAVHGQLLAGDSTSPRAGYLAALGRLELHGRELTGPARLDVRARRLAGDSAGQVYQFSVNVDDRPVADGQATVMFSDDSSSKG